MAAWAPMAETGASFPMGTWAPTVGIGALVPMAATGARRTDQVGSLGAGTFRGSVGSVGSLNRFGGVGSTGTLRSGIAPYHPLQGNLAGQNRVGYGRDFGHGLEHRRDFDHDFGRRGFYPLGLSGSAGLALAGAILGGTATPRCLGGPTAAMVTTATTATSPTTVIRPTPTTRSIPT